MVNAQSQGKMSDRGMMGDQTSLSPSTFILLFLGKNRGPCAYDQTQMLSFHLPDPVISIAQRSGVRSKWAGSGRFRVDTSA